MATSDNDGPLRDLISRLESVEEGEKRREDFCFIFSHWYRFRNAELNDRVVIELMNCRRLFPSVEDKSYFLKHALHERAEEMIELLENSGLDIHEARFEDGESAVHYLADELYWINDTSTDPKGKVLKLMEYFLENPVRNYADEDGYTYLHAACMSGNVQAANLLLSQGVDVNLDTYVCSPLHIAARYRHPRVVELLLMRGADPNKLDAGQSTPLHALTRLCLCECTNGVQFCDKRKPVDEIIQTLIEYGANIEAPNRYGDSPLHLAVSRFDVQLVESLLAHGASLDNLCEYRMFGAEFRSIELANYPLTLNIIEMVQLLQSAGFKMSLYTRLRMIKFWLSIREDDTQHLRPELDESIRDPIVALKPIVYNSFIFDTLSIYKSQEVMNFFQRTQESCADIWNSCHATRGFVDTCNQQFASTKTIMLTKDVSLYKLCQMSYGEGYSKLKNMENWCIPPINNLSCTEINLIVKRHVANIFIRPQLKLCVADLFMEDYSQLHLPYVTVRRVVEYMSYEELVRLCRQA
ncbi:uncharacterized protein LOC106652725 [Trichogramma pretiosum]|uniref:uncharacterized protein LOC106652725 n=1 Tax=Trichogramma pretiosum TaxID=7493 RepID=UPI0006C98E07|nr:uncharacterized protein LOC106652725 [Trichogramma pretiosum]